MKSGRSDRDLVASVLARAGCLRVAGEGSPADLVELAQAYLRLEGRLDKIIAIGDKYQAEALEASGRLRDALERLARYEGRGESTLGRGDESRPEQPEGETGLSSHRSEDQLLARIKAALEQGEAFLPDDVRGLLKRYEKMDARLDKIVRISDSFQGQLREVSLRMEYMARTDALTGLSNRRDMVERLDRELARFSRYGAVFSIILFDIDDFKPVNDRHGHDVGDQALRTVAYVFGQELRKTDVCARWGGEEFLILCPETRSAEAFLVGEKCRRAIGASSMHSREGELRVTMSGGICGAEPGLTVDELVKRADDALYRAKASGKNIIASWPLS
ncbi:MAG TPA: diguanylate cyclase [Rectinemataceae bacterium]|nr:diguanylate cyclase [Rectinemataceae bacterium]